MISYNVPINAQRMTIGVQGETNVREFLFDVSEWRELTGDIGTAQMVVQRNGDASPYATTITMHDENTVSWIPTETDTAKAGAGKIELMWIAEGQTVKTKIFLMKVEPSLEYAVPDSSLDPWASWMPDIINAGVAVNNFPGTVADAVSDWLDEHIEPTTPTVDDTLSVSGAAADAKVTGDLLGDAIKYRGPLNTTTITPDTVEGVGYWTVTSSVATDLLGKTSAGGIFFNLPSRTSNLLQMFALTDGLILSRYQTTGEFKTKNIAIQYPAANDPDIVTQPGVYLASSSTAYSYTGYNPGHNVPFVCLTTPSSAGTVIWQAFLFEDGRIFSRPGITGDFTGVSAQVDALVKYNAVDVLVHANRTDTTDFYGITATWNSDGSCTVVGTNSTAVGIPMWRRTYPLPDWITLGKTYFLKMDGNTVQYNIVAYDDRGTQIQYFTSYSDAVYTVPSNTASITLQLRVPPGTHNETVNPVLLTDIPGVDVISQIGEEVSLPLAVSVTSSGVIVKEGNLKIEWAKNGANSLVNLKDAYWGDTLLFATNTDWIGPYDFLAVNDADGDRLDPSKGVQSTNTTGGNHNIHTGDPSTGTPTARTISWSVYADEKEVPAGKTVSCSKLKIQWVNRVQAGNTAKLDKDASGYGTGRECLEEHCFAEFCGGGLINVGVDFMPLEEINMKWYSGLQFAGNSFAPDFYIPEYSNELVGVGYINDNRNAEKVSYATAIGDNVSLEMYMNRDYGCGKNTLDYYYSGGSQGTGQKGYFILFSRGQDPVNMQEGERYAWRGYYRFFPSV